MTVSPASDRQEHIQKFLADHALTGAELLPLAGDASFRRYIRLKKGEQSFMLMDAPPGKENVRPYLTIAEHLHRHGYSTPAILGADVAGGLLLLEDLGDDLFSSVLKRSEGAAKEALEHTLYAEAIDLLADWHGRKDILANATTLLLPDYDERLLMPEIMLFADWYLPQIMGREQAAKLKPEFMALWQKIIDRTPLATDHWVHRDYHADNLLWLPAREGLKRLGILDFQDGVYGDAAYDLVSLLEDARRDVPPALAEEMLGRYIAARGVEKAHFMENYAVLGAQRNSKIVGIFVRLAARDGKYGYLEFLPRVWRYLERDLQHPALSDLKKWLDKHVTRESRGAIKVTHTWRDLALSA